MSSGAALTCDICFESFYSNSAADGDRRPVVVCANGHTCCSGCAEQIRVCFACREPCFERPIPNVAVVRMVDENARALENIPEIPLAELAPAREGL